MKKLSCAEARQIDLVDYLASLGFHAVKATGTDHWYFSPFRKERTPSFKVNRSMNVFYDHGSGEGGNIIDFGILYHRLPVGDFLQLLSQDYQASTFSFHPPLPAARHGSRERNIRPAAKTLVIATRQLISLPLLKYSTERGIPVEITARYCREVDFTLYGKTHTAIGFPHNGGGFELRNAYFKGSSSPKGPTFFDNGSDAVTVFEGFFNFLSYLTVEQDNPFAMTNFLVLNSLSFFQKAKELMDAHKQVDLLLDRGSAGRSCTAAALKSHSRYTDGSSFYGEYEDLNDWLVQSRK